MIQNKVLISGFIAHARKELQEKIGSIAEVVQLDSPSREAFFQDLSTKYAGITAIYRHNDSTDFIGVFDAELIGRLPDTVRFICHNGAGYDQIDVAAATRRGIQVSHTPSAVDDATATTTIFLIVSALRQYWKAEDNARKGLWKTGLKPGSDPEGKVLGIVGMGGIGSAVARRAIGFGMTVQYYNRNPINPPPPYAKYVSMDELLATSDVVSLNLPLNSATKGSFGEAQFNKMKDGAVIVNTARGAILDQEAFIRALQSGKLSAAGIDVYPAEPTIDPRFLAMNNVTLLPHMGTETRETQKKMEVLTFDNIVSAISGKGLLNQVKEQKGVAFA